jgi:uncharacterized protein YraI
MNIQHHLKSIILASTLALSCGAMQVSFGANYKIINVDSWDTLNVRSGAGTGYDVISEIPASSKNIQIISSEKEVGGATWVKVKWNGQSGWVNKHYLAVSGDTVTHNIKQTYYNPQPATTTYAARTAGNTHTHPANRCTRTITHTHIGSAGHSHRYSCQKGRQQQSRSNIDIYGNQRVSQNANTHRHPANRCTRSILHTHVNGARDHSHRYSCQNNRGRQVLQTNRLQHTHSKSQCVSAISHAHKGGDRIHRHQCPSSSNRNQLENRHTHPANSLTRATTHSHPYQDKKHSHHYGRR